MIEKDKKTDRLVKTKPKAKVQPTLDTSFVVKPRKKAVKTSTPKPDYGKCAVCGSSRISLVLNSRAEKLQSAIACDNPDCKAYRYAIAWQ